MCFCWNCHRGLSREAAFETICQHIDRREWCQLHQFDELQRELKAGNLLHLFTTPLPLFAPTFKRHRARSEKPQTRSRSSSKSDCKSANSSRQSSFSETQPKGAVSTNGVNTAASVLDSAFNEEFFIQLEKSLNHITKMNEPEIDSNPRLIPDATTNEDMVVSAENDVEEGDITFFVPSNFSSHDKSDHGQSEKSDLDFPINDYDTDLQVLRQPLSVQIFPAASDVASGGSNKAVTSRTGTGNWIPFSCHFNDHRMPSYCDRVLSKSLPAFEKNLSLHYYDSCEDVMTSDHIPVLAGFDLTLTGGAEDIIVTNRNKGMFEIRIDNMQVPQY